MQGQLRQRDESGSDLLNVVTRTSTTAVRDESWRVHKVPLVSARCATFMQPMYYSVSAVCITSAKNMILPSLKKIVFRSLITRSMSRYLNII